MFRPVVVSGPIVQVRPATAEKLGIRPAAILHQIAFMCSNRKQASTSSVHVSFTALQRSIQYVWRHTLIEAIGELETKGLLNVKRESGVNRYKPDPTWIKDLEAGLNRTDHHLHPAPTAPANKLNLPEALVLQQVHVRLYNRPKEHWIRASAKAWEKFTPYLNEGKFYRAFGRLRDMGIVCTQRRPTHTGVETVCRVNYQQLAAIAGWELDDSQPENYLQIALDPKPFSNCQIGVLKMQ